MEKYILWISGAYVVFALSAEKSVSTVLW